MADRPPPLADAVRTFYETYDEAGRLGVGAFQLEHARTLEMLDRLLPPPPATVLDVGGGPGVYAVALAAQGYHVHLIDPIARHIAKAQALAQKHPPHALAGSHVGDARHLSFRDEMADAVLLLGPLYHLVDRADRVQALREARRVVRPGGPVLCAVISRYASTLDGLFRGFLADPVFEALAERGRTDGQHRNPTGDPAYFTTAYFHLEDELAAECADAGLRHEQTYGLEGPAWLLPDFEARWADPAERQRLLDLARALETAPGLRGLSAHRLGLARRPASPETLEGAPAR